MSIVLVANEVVKHTKKSNKSGLVFKIDFEHAYDHVERKFVDDVLEDREVGSRVF